MSSEVQALGRPFIKLPRRRKRPLDRTLKIRHVLGVWQSGQDFAPAADLHHAAAV